MLVLMLLTLPSRARLTSVWMPDLKGTVLQAVVRRLPVLVELCAVQRVDSCNCGNNPPCSASEQASAWKLQCRACAFAQRLLASLGESGLEPGHFASSSSPFRADFLLFARGLVTSHSPTCRHVLARGTQQRTDGL